MLKTAIEKIGKSDINRITVEFKYRHGDAEERHWQEILIESQWNLNIFVDAKSSAYININRITVEFKFVFSCSD